MPCCGIRGWCLASTRVDFVGTGTGTGGWGGQHARIFSRRADIELVAVVGRNPERTSARAQAYGTTAFTDVETMLVETAICPQKYGTDNRLDVDAVGWANGYHDGWFKLLRLIEPLVW